MLLYDVPLAEVRTLIDVGSADDNGIDVFCKANFEFPTAVHAFKVDANSSAQIPPSPE